MTSLLIEYKEDNIYISKKQYYKLRLFFFNIRFKESHGKGNIISLGLYLISELTSMLHLFHTCNLQSMALDTLKDKCVLAKSLFIYSVSYSSVFSSGITFLNVLLSCCQGWHG